MGLVIQGGNGNNADVTAENDLQVALSQTLADVGFAGMAGVSDEGTIIGSRTVREIEPSRDYRLRVGTDTMLFDAVFPGAAIDTGRWSQAVTTMTIALSNGRVQLNSGGSVATSTYAVFSTYRFFPMFATFPTYGETLVEFLSTPLLNNVVEIGFMLAATNAAPTDGVFMRYTATGNAYLVVNYNGTETQSASFDATTILSQSQTQKLVIGVTEDRAELWVNDILITVIELPAGQATMTASSSLPFVYRTYNSGATLLPQSVQISLLNVTLGDMQTYKPWAHTLSGMGAMGYEGQAGNTLGTTAQYANNQSAATGQAAATNTAAQLGSGLGGQFNLLPTLAAGSDGIISSYRNPPGTAALPGTNLYVCGIKINGVVTTVLAGGPVIGFWSIAYGHTAVSLATGEGVAAKAPRRVPLGIQVFPVTAAVGTRDDRDIYIKFDTPIFVQPGEFFQTVLKNLGTVTTTGAITWNITVDSYWA